jgi:Tat protein translocase TatB subunit
MGEFSFSELVVIVIIAILIYGKELPQVARKMAQMYNKLRRQLTDIKDEVQRQIPADEMRKALDVDTYGSSPTTDPPQTPYGVTASAQGRQVYVTWNSVPNAQSYIVKRARDKSEPFTILTMSVTDLAFTDADVPEGTWYYCVSASNSAGESANSDDACVQVVAEAPPAPPPAAEAAPPENGTAPTPAPAPETTPGPSSA